MNFFATRLGCSYRDSDSDIGSRPVEQVVRWPPRRGIGGLHRIEEEVLLEHAVVQAAAGHLRHGVGRRVTALSLGDRTEPAIAVWLELPTEKLFRRFAPDHTVGR